MTNMAYFSFPWSGRFRFFRNVFDFGDKWGTRSWLFAFGLGSTVRFQDNNFCNSSLQVQCIFDADGSVIETLSWNKREALLVKDDTYYMAMIRKNYGLPDSVRLEVDFLHSYNIGLHDVTFFGNKGIDSLELYCRARNYTFNGGNQIGSLYFGEFGSNLVRQHDCRIYFGVREKVDVDFRQPVRHRRLFVSLRSLAVNHQDARLLSTLDKQIARFEYFLIKDQNISLRSGAVVWFEYLQDRTLHAWRRWSSDFHRSWFRPLAMIVVGYSVSNAIGGLWIEDFAAVDWVTLCLRPINKIPFYVDSLSEIFGSRYDDLPKERKNWLMFVGLVQIIWVALWSFSFRTTIKK
jgi:hypothetical protein